MYVIILIPACLFFENLYSPDKVHPVAKEPKQNNIKLTNLTINNTVIIASESSDFMALYKSDFNFNL